MIRPRTLAFSLLLIAAFITAPASRYFTRMARAEEQKKQKTALDHKMEVMDEAMKKLKRTLKKSSENEESIKLCDEILQAATACRELAPARAASVPEADRKRFVEEYKKTMAHLIETIQEMKKAVTAGDNAKATELYKSLKTQKEDGHDKFMEDSSSKTNEKKSDK